MRKWLSIGIVILVALSLVIGLLGPAVASAKERGAADTVTAYVKALPDLKKTDVTAGYWVPDKQAGVKAQLDAIPRDTTISMKLVGKLKTTGQDGGPATVTGTYKTDLQYRKQKQSLGQKAITFTLDKKGDPKKYPWLISNSDLDLESLVVRTTASPKSTPKLTTTPTLTASTSSGAVVDAIEAVLENIYNQVNPSVVNISVTLSGGQGLGSGFVWDTSGNIVTNNHVVDGAIDMSVTFSDSTVVPAQVVGTDPDSDLAVVKVSVPASELHPVTLGDSTQAKVGQLTVAIGNPFGLQGTMTVGFISALGRLMPVDSGTSVAQSYNIPDIIQTDAPINPGNSGGVLINSHSQIIGVPSSIISESGSSAGIGFAIPSVIVKRVVPALITTGRYQHPYLGISGTSLNSAIAQAMGLTQNQRGALVATVVADGPAAKAGLQGGNQQTNINGQQITIGGDVIISINGKTITSFDDLITYLSRYTDVGQTVTLVILRQGKQNTVKLTLGARP